MQIILSRKEIEKILFDHLETMYGLAIKKDQPCLYVGREPDSYQEDSVQFKVDTEF